MPLVDLDVVRNLVRPEVGACPVATIDTHIILAAARFCAMSRLWREAFSGSTVIDEPDFTPAIPDGSALEDVLWVKVADSKPIDRISDRDEPPSAETGQPNRYSIYKDSKIRFYDTPDAVYSVSGVAVVKPAITATQLEDWLVNHHAEAISFGALSRLLLMKNKEWTDFEAAAGYGQAFQTAIDNAGARDDRKTKRRTIAYFQ